MFVKLLSEYDINVRTQNAKQVRMIIAHTCVEYTSNDSNKRHPTNNIIKNIFARRGCGQGEIILYNVRLQSTQDGHPNAGLPRRELLSR